MKIQHKPSDQWESITTTERCVDGRAMEPLDARFYIYMFELNDFRISLFNMNSRPRCFAIYEAFKTRTQLM